MKVKRFIGENMNDAVSKVRAHFGAEAVILQTKRIRRGGLFGLFAPRKVEVVAAIDPKAGENPEWKAALRKARATMSKSVPGGISKPAGQGPSPGEKTVNILQEQIAELKRMLADIGSSIPEKEVRDWPEPLGEYYRLLCENEVNQQQAVEITSAVLASCAGNERGSDLYTLFKQQVSSRILVCPAWDLESQRRCVALVGATGVGKTTTVAKLAANYALIGGYDVGLITVDTYRIAAVEQLRTYADIIGVPLKVASTAGELRRAVAAYRDMDLTLIDTAGRSQNNEMKMAELRHVLQEVDDVEVHLVLSATTSESDACQIIDKFNVLPFDYLMFTKLDETSSFGIILNLSQLLKKPLSFVTTGQSVPEDIEVADSDDLATMILGRAGQGSRVS